MLGFQPKMYWWPLPGVKKNVPVDTHPGTYACVRKFDVHTGVDLYCEPGQIVTSCWPGTVISVEPFTGEHADSPWWNNTWAVVVRGNDDVVLCYGEVKPLVSVGQELDIGQPLGVVIPVLKHDKGKPMTMLHFEKYSLDFKETVWWKHGEDKPEALLDPTDDLLDSFDNVGAQETALTVLSEADFVKFLEIIEDEEPSEALVRAIKEMKNG